MFKVLGHIQKRLVYYLPLTMLLAIIYGNYFDVRHLKALTPIIVFLMVYPMMIVLKYSELMSKGNNKLLVVSQLINFIIFPIAGYFIGKVFFADNQYLIIGILLMALLPTSGMTISWTGFAKGNVPEAIKMMIVGLILGAVLTPFYLGIFVGESVNIPFSGIILEIIKVVFIPMALGFATQKFLIKKFGMENIIINSS